jgi:hypothetical protein
VTKSWKPAATLLVAGLALAGCEQLDATAGVEPPPAEGRGYPNLASVPRPPPVAPPATRQAEVDRLMATRDASLRGDQELRALDPGSALPPPASRAKPDAPRSAAQPQDGGQPAPQAAPPRTSPPPQAAVTMPRPRLPSSLFMGTVVAADERGPLADFQRKVLEDSAAMAKRTGGRIRLVGGRSASDRQAVADELVRLGMPANRVVAAAADNGQARPAIDVLVEN